MVVSDGESEKIKSKEKKRMKKRSKTDVDDIVPMGEDVAAPTSDMDKMIAEELTGSKRKAGGDGMDVDSEEEGGRPHYPPMKKSRGEGVDKEIRKVPVPSNRYSPLKENWLRIFTPIVEHLNLQVRFNLKTRNVEIRTCKKTEDTTNLQKAADFVRAFILGFDVEDALALIRLDDLFVDSFEIGDVKPLHGDHLSRAVGRVAGKGGKTKFTIENVSKTRIVLADTKIHILGSYSNIQIAKRALCNLIMGSPPSKVYGNLRVAANRTSERF